MRKSGQELEPVDDSQALELTPEKRYGYATFLGLVFRTYPKRAVLGATLMITQSFLYNAIYFTYGLVLVQFYGVAADKVPLYGLAFAVGNLCGPLILAPLFRQRGPEADDLGHVHHLGRPARDQRLAVRQGPPRRDDADVLLDRHLLLRLGWGERRLPHRQRDVADRDPRRSDRGLLRHRADLRSVRPRLLRLADRRRLQSDRALHRLRDRGRDHGHRRDRRARDRDQGGGRNRSKTSRNRSPRPPNRRRPRRSRPRPEEDRWTTTT